MYCLTNICYVCLKKKNNLISSVNSSLSVNEELRRIIGYHAFNQPWLKTKRNILTCEDCYSQLRKTYQFLIMWHKNTVLLQGYIDLLNATPMSNTDNEAELHVHADMKQTDINDVKREVKLENEQIYTFQWEHNIEETKDALIIEETKELYMNLEDSFVKEENTWKQEEVDDSEECSTDNNSTEIIAELRDEGNDTQEYPMGNISTESTDNESDSKTSINDNPHLTNTDSISSGFAGKQMHATKKSYKCSTCNKTFITKTEFTVHKRIHAEKKSYECAVCKKRFNRNSHLVCHMRVHTGEKSYECTTCKKCYKQNSYLVRHVHTHTGEKPYECATCKKCFARRSNLVLHMRIHTGKKPYECSKCSKCFRFKSNIKCHMRNKHPDEESH